MGRSQKGYCYEQFIKLYPEFLGKKYVETEGSWKGFWIDSETGKHWGNIGTLSAQRIKVDSTTLRRYAKKIKLKVIEIIDITGRSAEAYCYEDFIENERFLDLITAPHVDKEGIWAGFWTDNKGQHWAPVVNLADYFNIDPSSIISHAKDMKLERKNVITTNKSLTVAFCLESFKLDINFMEFLNLPRISTKGVWTGFYTDKNNNHFGSIREISKKLSISHREIDKLIHDKTNNLSTVPIRHASGHRMIGFCLEEIIEKLSKGTPD